MIRMNGSTGSRNLTKPSGIFLRLQAKHFHDLAEITPHLLPRISGVISQQVGWMERRHHGNSQYVGLVACPTPSDSCDALGGLENELRRWPTQCHDDFRANEFYLTSQIRGGCFNFFLSGIS